jgi:sulfur transfer protein SufE
MLESIGFKWKLRENKRSAGLPKSTGATAAVAATATAESITESVDSSESSSEQTPFSDLDGEEEHASSSVAPSAAETTHRRSMQWNERYQQLLEFKDQNGHCNVPQKWKENKQLGKWCSHQRMHYHHWLEGKYSPLTEDRRLLLESIGFVTRKLPDKHWTQRSWDERYKQLLEYKARFENTNVPKKWPENRQLGIWVMNQRTQYQRWLMGKPTTLTTERREMLESIGFDAGKYRNLVASKQKDLEETSGEATGGDGEVDTDNGGRADRCLPTKDANDK